MNKETVVEPKSKYSNLYDNAPNTRWPGELNEKPTPGLFGLPECWLLFQDPKAIDPASTVFLLFHNYNQL